jgi:hypothetical protein
MFVLKVLPILIFILQLASLVHLYIVNKTGHAHVPMAFIELHAIVIVNIIIFLSIYFFVYKIKLESYWVLPLITALICVLLLVYFYVRMLF